MRKQYTQLSLEEREQIAILKASGKSLRNIAAFVGKHTSTISRELKRNQFRAFGFLGYGPARAHLATRKRKSCAAKRLRLKNQIIRNYVCDKIKSFWSPEQIAGRIAIELLGHHVSHEAIYQFIYNDARFLIPFLPRKHQNQ